LKVFISWSGQRSQAVAEALRDWLPLVIQKLHGNVWLSSKDITPGSRWSQTLEKELESTHFGILCLTPENRTSHYLHFEAGALAKQVEKSSLVPYLLDMTPSQVEEPLASFQWVHASPEGTLALLNSIRKALGEEAPAEELMKRSFEALWDDLKRRLERLPPPEDGKPERRPEHAVLEEILDHVRRLSNQMPDAWSETQRLIKEFARPSMAKSEPPTLKAESADPLPDEPGLKPTRG
jgi:hypothetical protein